MEPGGAAPRRAPQGRAERGGMRNNRDTPDERISAYRRAAEAMARGEFRPPLPRVVEGPAGDEIDRLGRALARLGS